MFSSASWNANNKLMSALVLEDSRYSNVDRETFITTKCQKAEIISIDTKTKDAHFDAISNAYSSIALDIGRTDAKVYVDISNANPVEAYMVSHYRPMFAYEVYTNKPREELMPAPITPSHIEEKHLRVLGEMIQKGRPVCSKDIRPDDSPKTTSEYRRAFKELENNGMIEMINDKEPHMRRNGDYYRPTKKGRYNYYAHSGEFDPNFKI
jgi:hypothetical protein